MPAKRKPVWKEVEEREQRKRKSRARAGRPPARRHVRVVYDVDGPRVRLGVAWFLLELVALVAGRFALGGLFALTAAVAALQTSRTWRQASRHPHRAVAGAGAGVIGFSGVVSTGLVGLAILVMVAAALVMAYVDAAHRRRADPVLDASFTVRCALFAGFAAACICVTARFEFGSAVGLLFVVGAYEAGDFLVGSGASNAYEGPVAGATAIVVVAFALGALGIKPFDFPRAFVFAGLAAVLCPAGQLVASEILPSPSAPASALRRIDSLLVLAPVWALAAGLLK